MPPCADPSLDLALVRLTESAALTAGRWVGRGDLEAGALAATAAVRAVLASVPLRGTIATDAGLTGSFAVGEQVGDGTGPARDVGLSPLDGAAPAARGTPGTIAAVAVTGHGRMLRAYPVGDMDTIAVGPGAGEAVDIDRPVAVNVRAVAAATARPVSAITVMVLGRSDPQGIARRVLDAGARVRRVAGGEIAGALAVSRPDSGVDMVLGVGGAHEGVLAAAALACAGGAMQARLRPRDAGERRRALAAGHDDLDAVLHARDLVGTEDVLFSATGITGRDALPGVRYRAGVAETSSVALCSGTGTVRVVEGVHRVDRLHDALPSDPDRALPVPRDRRSVTSARSAPAAVRSPRTG